MHSCSAPSQRMPLTVPSRVSYAAVKRGHCDFFDDHGSRGGGGGGGRAGRQLAAISVRQAVTNCATGYIPSNSHRQACMHPACSPPQRAESLMFPCGGACTLSLTGSEPLPAGAGHPGGRDRRRFGLFGKTVAISMCTRERWTRSRQQAVACAWVEQRAPSSSSSRISLRRRGYGLASTNDADKRDRDGTEIDSVSAASNYPHITVVT